MSAPVCVPCQRFFRIRRNGYALIEGMPIANDALPGNSQPDKWIPYKLWQSDRYECEGCGAMIAIRAGAPIAVKHETNFAELVERLQPELQVNDC